eukprot:4215806-Alexandrium_andersonii.AAC.1
MAARARPGWGMPASFAQATASPSVGSHAAVAAACSRRRPPNSLKTSAAPTANMKQILPFPSKGAAMRRNA